MSTGRVRVGGLPVDPLRLEDAVARVVAAVERRERLLVTALNPDYGRRALRSPGLRADIERFDLVLADGNGVRLVGLLHGVRVPQRLDTDTFAPAVLAALAARSGRIFLFGCAPGVAETAARRLEQQHRGLQIVGTLDGFADARRGHPGRYADEDTRALLARLDELRPDLLVVSVPTPLQQRWCVEHADELVVPVVLTAGSWLDHVADLSGGEFYPHWVHGLQLNWLYRLAREPRRLWRRYTVEMLEYIVRALREQLRG